MARLNKCDSELVGRIPLDPNSELRVRAMEDAGGRPVIDLRVWRKSPADTSESAFCPTVGGFTVPLALFPLVLRFAWKVLRRAEERTCWDLATATMPVNVATRPADASESPAA